jgi:hypothetical protein
VLCVDSQERKESIPRYTDIQECWSVRALNWTFFWVERSALLKDLLKLAVVVWLEKDLYWMC